MAFVMKERGLMRTRTGWLTLLLTAGMALSSTAAWGQDYTPPDPVLPFPLYSGRPEMGGFFTGVEFIMWRETNPLKHQIVATRGLVDFDGTITADLTGTLIEPLNGGPPFILPGPRVPGNFIGSNRGVLFADDARGPVTYQPGFNFIAGWKFRNETAVDVEWMHLAQAKYSATATLVPSGLNPGLNLSETFLFAPVYNFPNDFAGPADKLALGGPFAAYGVWNGASIMQVSFVQRFEQVDITGRIPYYQDDCNRCYGLIGPRFLWMWEKFQWRTVSEDFTGVATPQDVAIYSNIVSNRLYGADIGLGFDRRLSDTPVGTFAASLDLRVAGLLDVVKERAKYERGDHAIGSHRSKTEYTMVPEGQASASVWWYPIEGVEVKIGYDFMVFYNTIASPNPVSFNYGGVDPAWVRGQLRYLDGIHAGITFSF
jgi:hypothetical protein